MSAHEWICNVIPAVTADWLELQWHSMISSWSCGWMSTEPGSGQLVRTWTVNTVKWAFEYWRKSQSKSHLLSFMIMWTQFCNLCKQVVKFNFITQRLRWLSHRRYSLITPWTFTWFDIKLSQVLFLLVLCNIRETESQCKKVFYFSQAQESLEMDLKDEISEFSWGHFNFSLSYCKLRACLFGSSEVVFPDLGEFDDMTFLLCRLFTEPSSMVTPGLSLFFLKSLNKWTHPPMGDDSTPPPPSPSAFYLCLTRLLRKRVLPLKEQNKGSLTWRHEFLNGVNINVIPDVCVYHCGILWWCRMWSFCTLWQQTLKTRSITVKAFTNNQVQFTSRDIWILPAYLFKEWRVSVKNHNALVLYIPPFEILCVHSGAEVCSLSSGWKLWRTNRVLSVTVKNQLDEPKQENIPLLLANCSDIICEKQKSIRCIQGFWLRDQIPLFQRWGLGVFTTKTTKWTSC